MKKRILGLFLASTLTLTFTGCATSRNAAAWEYKVVTMHAYDDQMDAKINGLTQKGWHLVSVAVGNSAVDTASVPMTVMVFKRHK